MSAWSPTNIVLTTQGQQALAYVQGGVGKLTITKVVTGSGRVTDALLSSQTAVSTEVQELSVTSISIADDTTSMKARVSNSGVTTQYSLNQIGVYANHPNIGNFLYMIAQCDTPADVVPVESVTPVTLYYDLFIKHVGVTAENIVVTVPVAGVVSVEQYDALVITVGSKADKSYCDGAFATKTELASLGTTVDTKAPKPVLADITLGTSWTGTSIPYKQSVTNALIKSNSNGVLTLKNTGTAAAFTAAYKAVQQAQLFLGTQADGSLEVLCLGKIPTTSLTLQLVLTGESTGGKIIPAFPGGSSEDYGGKTPLLKSATGTTNEDGYFYGDANVAPTGVTPLLYSGYLSATRVLNVYFNDYAEVYTVKPGWGYGDVVSLSEDEEYELKVSDITYDSRAYGVISSEWAFLIGGSVDEDHPENAPVALAGKVPVKVSGPCRKNYYLYTSNIPGVAKAAATLADVPDGCVFGRALHGKKTTEAVELIKCVIWRG